MSTNAAKLCSMLIEDSFGFPVQKTAEVLLSRGPCTLHATVVGVDLPRPNLIPVQEALKILIQHCFVVIVNPPPPEEDGDPPGPLKYKILPERVLEQLRYPRYFELTETRLGSVAREIMEEVIRAGCLPLSKLLYICAHRVKTTNTEIQDSPLYDQLLLFRTTIQNLIHRKFLTISDLTAGGGDHEKSVAELEAHQNQVQKELLRIPMIDLNKICTKIMTEPVAKPEVAAEGDNKATGTSNTLETTTEKKEIIDMESFTDADVLWTINIRQYHSEVRNAVVLKAMETKFKGMMVDTRIIQILIELGFEKNPWDKDGAPVNTPEIKDKLEKMEAGALSSKFLHEHMEILEDDPKMLLNRLSTNQGGIFSFNMKAALEELMWSSVDRIIVERHGFLALRIFRLIKDKGFLEQDAINELGMIPAKDAKHLTYTLVEDHFLFLKEIRKSYAPSAPPGKVAHVFYIDKNQVVRTLKESCFKAMVNLKFRIKAEEQKNIRIINKEERINRILGNMTSKDCTEEQLSEVRDLITPPEREVLMKIQFQTNKLISGMMHVDQTLFVIQMYMLYHRRPIPTGKRKQNN